MTECAQCGDCCRDMHINRTRAQLREYVKLGPNDSTYEDAVFALKHWHRSGGGGTSTTYTCDMLDGDKCTAYDTRPPVCRGYPWHGKPPGLHKILHDRCSFWHDIPRDQWPESANPLPSPVAIGPRP